MEWQHHVSNVAGELLPSGRMAYPVVVLIVPRRGGKSVQSLATNVQRCAAIPRARCWYTAQTGQLAGEVFREEWVPLVESGPLNRVIRKRLSNGSERMAVGTKGSRFGVFAPTETALHSKDGDVVTFDEAWAHSDAKGSLLEAAARPIMLTRPKRQLWIISAGGTQLSTWLLRYRALGRSLNSTEVDGRYVIGPDQGLAYFEWHPPVLPKPGGDYRLDPTVDLDSPATWADNHPALGRTIDLATLVEDRKTYGASVFHRTILDVFQTSAGDRIIDAGQWEAAGDAALELPDGGLSVFYDVDEDRGHSAVAVAGRLPDGRLGAELVAARPGVDWVAPLVDELRRTRAFQVLGDGYGPATTVTRELRKLGCEVDELDTGRYVDAAAELLDELRLNVLVPTVAIRTEEALDLAAGVVEWRSIGDRKAFSRKASGGPVAPVIAVAGALHGARHRVARKPVIRLSSS